MIGCPDHVDFAVGTTRDHVALFRLGFGNEAKRGLISVAGNAAVVTRDATLIT